MPNYIRTTNPWIAAADALDQGVSPLARMYTQLPQVRAQMQQHADQMGIAQGRLMLDQQESQARLPVFAAQAANYNAESGLRNQQAEEIAQLLRNAAVGSQGDAQALARAAAFSALTNPNAAQGLRNDITKPLTLNANETAFSNPQMGTPTPIAQGVVNAPFGNTVLAPAALGGTNVNPAPLQVGQFSPHASTELDPASAALRLGELAKIANEYGGAAGRTNAMTLLDAAQKRAMGGGQPAPGGGGSDRVKVVGPNGERGTMPKTSALPQGWKIVQ